MKKVITIKQPWATLIVEGNKNVENRTWQTKYRGELYIHSSKNSFDFFCLDFLKENDYLLYQYIMIYFGIKNNKITRHINMFGSIIGKTNLYDIVDNSDSKWAMGNSYHWLLKDSQKIEPIPCKGKLNIWEIDI